MNSQAVYFSKTELPIIFDCDVLITGASFSGIAAALQLSRAGKKVCVVEARTYPACETTATLRPWIDVPSDSCPEWLRHLLANSGVQISSGEIALNLDTLKIQLEDLLLNANIKLLYATTPVSIHADEAGHTVVIGNKGGRQAIRCKHIIDATVEQTWTHLQRHHTQEGFSPSSHKHTHTSTYAFTLEFDNVSWTAQENTLPAPPELSFSDGMFHIHRGYRSPQHILVECRAIFPAVDSDASGDSKRLAYKSQLAMEAAIYLMQQPAFKNAYLAGISYELSSIGDNTASIYERVREGEAAADDVLAGETTLSSSDGLQSDGLQSDDSPLDEHPTIQISELNSSKHSSTQAVPPLRLRVVREVDVLVVGGGTSGATAAYIAGRQGMNTLLVEMNPGLGGTGTFGGVHSYWFGRRTGFSAALSERVNAVHKHMGHREAQGVLPKWNIEAKSYTLLKDATDAGVEVLFNAITIGVLHEANTVCGIVVATRYGVIALKGKIIIDATGDADIATQAGAEVVYGSERDHTTMWYALAQFARPGLTQNHFTSTVDVSDVEDYTRAILAGRRRRRNDNMHDHGIYIAPRESRHMRGEVVLTLTDQLLRRAWEDTINVTFSNHDIKGHTTADWLRVGLIPPNLLIEIPYRALLPAQLENIIVVGKAISATHDALPAIRMQADLENLGGAAGLAASLAIQCGVTARKIPVKDLQTSLAEAGVLPESILTRELQTQALDTQALNTLIQRVASDQPLYLYSDMDLNAIYEGDIPLVELCCSGQSTLSLIESALAQAAPDEQLKLATALALMGSSSARPILFNALVERLENDPLPARNVHIHHTQLPPDQGAMPEECNLLYALGMVADENLLAVWSQLIDHLSEVDGDDLRDEKKGIFYYVDSICFGMERLGSSKAIEALKRLHHNPIFHHQMSETGFQVDYFLERQAYLEIVIARTLARCGSADGYHVLIDYLRDSRALLAKHALGELMRLTGENAGYDVAFWEDWLSTHREKITSQALQHPSEIKDYWQQTVLRETNS